MEVYWREKVDLRAGDRIRWTRNDAALGLVNSDTAEVAAVRGERVAFRLGDGRVLDLGLEDPQLRHLDYARASTVHAFQGRTVDNVIAAMEANHPHLTTQKGFYVEVSRVRRAGVGGRTGTGDVPRSRTGRRAQRGSRWRYLGIAGDGRDFGTRYGASPRVE